MFFLNAESSLGQAEIYIEGEKWIEIPDAETLAKIGSIGFPLDGNYLQTKNIDLSKFTIDGGWKGIGKSSANPFNGIFNGQGFDINGLTIHREEGTQGLFRFIGPKGILKGIQLTNVNINISGNKSYNGSLVGENIGQVINCAAISGELIATQYSGGLVGRNVENGIIEGSYSGIKVSGDRNIGGLVGYNYNGGIIKNSYASGEVSGEENIGGLIGWNRNVGNKKSYVINTYSSGLVNWNENGGGLLGNNTGEIENSYWNTETSKQTASVGESGKMEGKSDEAMKSESTFLNWNFQEIWQIREGKRMPYLKALGELDLIIEKKIPVLAFTLNGEEILNGSIIESTYGDVLNIQVISTSDGELSDLEFELSDSSVVRLSSLAEIQVTNVGSTFLKITQPETDTYEAEEVFFKIVITRAVTKITADSIQIHGYDGTSKAVVAELNHDEAELSYTPASSFIEVGEYTIQVHSPETSNYLGAELEVRLTINQATQEGITLEDSEFVYNGEKRYLSISGLSSEAESDTEVSYENNGHSNAGTYEVIATVRRPNFEDLILSATLTIKKAESEIVADSMQIHAYNGTAKAIIAHLNHEEVELIYTPASFFTEVGEYTIQVHSPETSNYWGAELEVKLMVNKAIQEGITLKDSEFVYNGEKRYLLVSDSTSKAEKNMEVSYENNGQSNAGTYEVIATVRRPNFEDLILSATLTIKKAESEIIADSIQIHGYDGTAKAIVAHLNHEEAGLIYSPSSFFTEAGLYKVEIFSKETKNYLNGSKKVILMIEEGNFENVILEDKIFIYDGNNYGLEVTNLPENAVVVYENNAHVNAGKYEVRAIVSKPNYQRLVLKGILTINRAPQVIFFEELDRVSRDVHQVKLNVKSTTELPIQLFGDDNLVASLDGHNLLIHRLGTVRIKATQEGNENHFPAEPVTRQLRVEDPAIGPIRVHQVISPNGDGINDFLIVEGIKEFPENRLQIINLSKKVVFDTIGYDNELRVFKGISNTGASQVNLPNGTYFYILKYRDRNYWQSKRGWIYLKAY